MTGHMILSDTAKCKVGVVRGESMRDGVCVGDSAVVVSSGTQPLGTGCGQGGLGGGEIEGEREGQSD